VHRGPHLAGDMIFNRPHENTPPRGPIQQRLDQKCSGCLAICPVIPVAVRLRSGWPKNAARPAPAHAVRGSTSSTVSLAERRAGVELGRRVGNDAQGACGNGLFHVAVAVCRAALHGHENARRGAPCASRTRRRPAARPNRRRNRLLSLPLLNLSSHHGSIVDFEADPTSSRNVEIFG